MPKPKPTEIIRHELVLGRKEMELVENALVYPSIVGSLKDLLPYVKDAATAIALIEGIATVLELMGIKTPLPTPVDLYDWLIENGYTYNELLKKWQRAEDIYEDPIGELVIDPVVDEANIYAMQIQQLLSLLFSGQINPFDRE
jgi:hypothetical protein